LVKPDQAGPVDGLRVLLQQPLLISRHPWTMKEATVGMPVWDCQSQFVVGYGPFQELYLGG
jgi:hypothetical protein